MKKKLLTLIPIILFSLSLVSAAQAATYYVSPTGSAFWTSCTNINTPCSAQTAFSNAAAGDTVYFRGGNYYITGTSSWYNPDLKPSNSGTPDAPINFEGYPGETAIFVANDANSPVLGTTEGTSWINFKNFTVDTSGVSSGNIRNAFKITGSNITIENCIVIGHSIPITDHHAGIAISDGGPFTIRNNKIYNWTGEDTSGISLWDVTNSVIEHNEIYNSYRGIDTVQVGLNNIYRYNYIHNITESGLRIYYQDGKGSSEAKIYQNIIANAGGGIYFNGGDGPLPNNLVYNNILYKAGNIGFVGCPYLEIFNNIIWHEVTSSDNEVASYIVYLGSTDPSIVNYNLYWGNPLMFGYRIYGGGIWYYSMPWSPNGYDVNSKNQNPSFVNAGSGLTTGFKLNVGSPALTGGRGGSYATVMGAYITGSEIIGTISEALPDTTPPSAPTNLTATTVSSSQINLSWTASTDNVGVTGYRIYRNGTYLRNTTGTSYQDTGLSPSTTYTYRVSAYDAAGNEGNQSSPASATTQSSLPPSSNECNDWQTLHPEWIFCDDFESTNPLVGQERYFEYDDNNGDFIAMNGIGLNNSRGMGALWQQGEVAAGGLKLGFGRNPSGYMNKGIRPNEDFRDIYYRMYLKMQDGWTGDPAKLSRATIIARSDWSQAMIAHLWGDGQNHLLVDPVSCVDASNNVVCSGYNDFAHMTWLGSQSGPTPIFDSSHANRWYCVESHVRLNDPSQSNGIQEFWIDEQLEARRNNLNFVRSYTDYGINAIFFENYWNSGSPKQQERYFDNIVVSTQRIGCSVANQSCPKSDTNCNNCVEMEELNTFIDRWKISNLDVTIREIIEAIGEWKRGCL